jgi:hypothetical protein
VPDFPSVRSPVAQSNDFLAILAVFLKQLIQLIDRFFCLSHCASDHLGAMFNHFQMDVIG